MTGRSSWEAALLSRLGDRAILSREEVWQTYWPKLPRAQVFAVADLINDAFGIPFGALRPSDELRVLFEPVETRNPLKWLVYQARAEDRSDWLDEEIARRLKQHDIVQEWSEQAEILTIDDYIRAWCGLHPKA